MTSAQIAMLIIKRWRLQQTIDETMVGLYRLGYPLTKATILKVIRTYVDVSSENNAYRRRASGLADRRS